LRGHFATWDPLLVAVLAQVKSVQKWKLLHLDPLDTWVRGSVALIGDACHPTLPYQGQGAAMAVKDGATIARSLGLLSERVQTYASGVKATGVAPQDICRVLRLYELIRKQRSEMNVRVAEMTRTIFHLPSGPEMERRDQMIRDFDWEDPHAKSDWPFFDPAYARELLGFDAERESKNAFDREFANPKQETSHRL